MSDHRRHRRGVPAASPAAVACALLTCAGSASAQVVGRFSAFASVGDGYSDNPFLLEDDNTGSGYLEVTFAPTYQLLEPTANTSLSGIYRRSEYFRRYNSSESYGASLIHNRRLDARTNLNLSIGFDSSIQGERESILAPPFAAEPQGPVPIPGTDPTPPVPEGAPTGTPLPVDPTLIGQALRRDALSVNAIISNSPSAFDTYSLSLRANRSFSGSPASADYRSFGQTTSYSRRLSELISVGGRVSIDRTDYLDARFPDATTVQPQLTYGHKLGPNLTLDAALGAVFVNSAGSDNSQSLSGNLSLCWLDARSTLCLSADRSASASGAGSVTNQLNAGLNYNYRLSSYDSVSATIGYSQSSQLAFDLDAEYLNTTVAWNTQATQRLTGGASLSFRRAFDPLRSASTDVNGQVYLRLGFGP